MTPSDFSASLAKSTPPNGVSPALTALWWIAKDNWDKAHAIVMNEDGAECAWVHAYLHRVEGDLDNAGYWYRKGRRKAATGDLAVERDSIVASLLEKESQ